MPRRMPIPITKEEAEELLDFVELYLTYVYTLPERLRLRRARRKGYGGQSGKLRHYRREWMT